MPIDPDPWQMVTDSIGQLRADVSAQLSALNARLDRLVTTDVHAESMRRVDDRIAEIKKDLVDERVARGEGIVMAVSAADRVAESVKAEHEARLVAFAEKERERKRDRAQFIGMLLSLATVVATYLLVLHR